MDFKIEISKRFEKDYKKLDSKSKKAIDERILKLAEHLKTDGQLGKFLYRIKKVHAPKSMSSSIYLFKIDMKLRVILSFELDPLFDSKILTLYGVAKHGELDKELKRISASLYKDFDSSKRIE